MDIKKYKVKIYIKRKILPIGVAELTSEYVRNLIIQQSSSILSVTTTNLNMQMVQSLLPKIG